MNLVSKPAIKSKMRTPMEIKIKGKLDETRTEWFDGLEISNEGNTPSCPGKKLTMHSSMVS